jgi:peptidoglycan hydrolase CwlO-like protein
MKKKFISVAMFSALLISTPVFVGCSDYDDDISNLQGQIDSLKGPDVSSSEALTALNNALNDLKADVATITSGKADNAAVIELQEKVTELTNLINGSDGNEGEIAGLAEQIKDLQEQVNSVKGDLDEKYEQLVQKQDELEGKIKSLNDQISKAASTEEVDSLKKVLDDHVKAWNEVSQDVTEAAAWVKNNGESLAKLTAQVTKIESLINVIYAAGEGTTIEDNEILAAIAALPTTNDDLAKLQETINGKGSEKGILGRLEDIETWKNTITEALIENKFVDGNGAASMSQALADLNWVKEQLKDGTNPDDPTILDRMNKLEENYATLAALASQVQSIVFVPSNYDDPYKLESEKLMILKPGTTNDFQLVGVKNENTISFRITPASAVKDFTKNYKLTFDGKEVRGVVTDLKVGEAQIDEANGIVTYQITNPPTVSAGSKGWAVCAKLIANTDKDENDQIINNNGTDLVSNYFVIGNKENYYKDITVKNSVAANRSVECYLDEPTENSTWDLTSSFQDAIGGTPCNNAGVATGVWTAIDFTSFGETPQLSYRAATSGVFNIESGVLTPANAGNAEIGRSSVINVTINIAGVTYNNANSFTVDIVRRTVNVNLNTTWSGNPTIKWNGLVDQYIKLPAEYTRKAINATELSTSDFFDLTDQNAGSRSGIYLIKGNEIGAGITDINGEAIEAQSLYLVIEAGSSIPSDQNLSLILEERASSGSSTTMTSSYTFNVAVAATDYSWLDDTQDKLVKKPGQWNGDNLSLNFNVNGSSLGKSFDLDEFYSNISTLRAKAANVGAKVSYEILTTPYSGVSLNTATGKLEFDAAGSQYNYINTPELKIKVKITFGNQPTSKVYDEHTAVYTVNPKTSGEWTGNIANSMTLGLLNESYYPLKGMEWVDYRGEKLVYWKETVQGDNTFGYVCNSILSSIYGNDDVKIGFVSGPNADINEPLKANDPNNYLYVNQNGATSASANFNGKGTVTFTENGKNANFETAVTATLRIKVSSRWSEIKGIEKGYYDITLTIPAGAHQ